MISPTAVRKRTKMRFSQTLRIEDAVDSIPESFHERVATNVVHKPRSYGISEVVKTVGKTIAAPFQYANAVRKHGLFYVSDAVGEGGETFKLYKLQTMHPNAPSLADSVADDIVITAKGKPKAADDPRLLPGAWLIRKLHIDELPMLYNVFKRDMKFGPGIRPKTKSYWLDNHSKRHRDMFYGQKPAFVPLSYAVCDSKTNKRQVQRLEREKALRNHGIEYQVWDGHSTQEAIEISLQKNMNRDPSLEKKYLALAFLNVATFRVAGV